MSDSIQPASSSSQGAGASVSSTGSAGGISKDVSSSTTVHSMEDLREKAPKIYNTILEGIAMEICNKMKASQERLKKLQDEAMRH